jgi:hypothetical protein
MAGKVLALKLGEWEELANGVVNTGYRVMLSVQFIQMDVQTTTFYGYNLFQMTYSPWGVGQVDVGSLNSISLFMNFLGSYKGKRSEWAQFVDPPYNAAYYLGRSYNLVPPPPEPPESKGPMVLENASYDACKGWWIRFKGNFRIAIPIFQDFPNVKDLTPDFSIKIK